MKETILAIKLKKYRTDNNLTQSDLAEKLDVSDKTISKWELGETYPSKKNMVKLAETLDISLEILLLEEKSGRNKEINWDELLYKLLLYIFLVIILVATLSNGNRLNIFIAIITGILFIIGEYLAIKNKQKQ